MIKRSTIQLLRFHFSLFLLPVYLFAISQATVIEFDRAALIFFILHLLVYPASNGYNSFMDRDETPIGGLASPMQPTPQLFYVTVMMDLLAVALSFIISVEFAAFVLVYILASRAYSYRGIRLKRFPVIGFFTVFIFQGGWIYFAISRAMGVEAVPLLPCITASLLIGALYPLTQIYQHEEDLADGVRTISYMVGKRGSFLLSMLMFLSANACQYFYFESGDKMNHFLLFTVLLLPVVLFFLYWLVQVWRDELKANFRNSFLMNIIATCCTILYFVTLIILNH